MRASQSWRTIAFVAALLCQAGIFLVAERFHRSSRLYADNFYYETPAWNLASGHGFSIEQSQANDPYLTDGYLARHPDGDHSFIPTTTLPPGYGLFLAGAYKVFGRSQLAAVLINGLLLMGTVAILGLLLRGQRQMAALIAFAFICSFPSWAFWASVIMSDMLHCALVTLFAFVWFRDRPTTGRALLAGLILGLAALVRPYVVLLPFAFVAWYYLIRRVDMFAPKRVAILALIAWAMVGCWSMRNYYEFGKVIPVTSMGIGSAFWLATYPAPFFDDADNVPEIRQARAKLEAAGLVDWHRHQESLELQKIAVERVKQHPGIYLRGLLQRTVRTWLSSVASGVPRLVIDGFFVLQLLTLVGMLGGLWLSFRSSDPVIAGAGVLVLYYWILFLPFHGEARVTLPARGFAFILAGLAYGKWLTRGVTKSVADNHLGSS